MAPVNPQDELQDSEELVSKTQLKKDSKAVHEFGAQLIELADGKLQQLPLSERSITAVRDYHKQSGYAAQKRHLAYIGKCLRSDDVEAAKEFLQENKFGQLRDKQQVKSSELETQLATLVESGEKAVQPLLEIYPSLERQTLRQLLRNYQKASSGSKQAAALNKLKQLLLEASN